MRAHSIVSSLALLGLAVALPDRAHAHGGSDTLHATRYEVVERSHVVDLKVDRGIATLVVQRTVANRGPKSDQATFFLDIPESAVATRLRTAAVSAQGQTTWFEGELMEAEAAAKKYQELTGIGGFYPKDPALLSWRHKGQLALQVFPVPGQSTKTVEYTLKMPLEYRDGAYHADIQPLGTDDLRASVRIATVHGEDALTVNGIQPPAPPATISANRMLSIELHPRNVASVDGVVASVPVAEGKHLVRARLAAAPHIGEVPKGAHVVVLFDNSRSMEHRDAALVAVRSYLGHMSGAVVDFMTFDREVKSPIGKTIPVADALSRLSTLLLEPKNGSRLDDALAKADAILQTSPALARRVIVVTDTLMRDGLGPDKVGATPWKSGAVVHFATVSDGQGLVQRDDDSPWATLPRRTGGLFWSATSPTEIDPLARLAFEEWARPKRIDKLVVKGLPDDYFASPTLEEGQSIEHFTIAQEGAPRVRLTGEIWSKPFDTTFTPTDEQAKLASALVFGSDLFGQLSEAEQMVLAMRGGAVSPVTSYLAIEPGVRPSNEGLDWGSIGHGFGAGSGQGFGNGHGRLGSMGTRPSFDKGAWLRGQLAAAVKHCGAVHTSTTSAITVALETTTIEVVEIGAVQTAPVRDAKIESCVREEMWSVALPGDFREDHESFDVGVTL